MNCPNCNTPVSDTARFCPGCGQALLETSRASRTIDLSPAEPTVESPLPPPIPPKVEELPQQTATVPQTARTEETTASTQSRILSSDGTRETKQIIKIVPSWKFDDNIEHGRLHQGILKVMIYVLAAIIGLVSIIQLTEGAIAWAIVTGLIAFGLIYWTKLKVIDNLKDYVPEKSFKTFRLTEKQLKSIFITIASIGIFFAVLFLFKSSEVVKNNGVGGFIKIVVEALLFILVGYHAYKALAVHGNVDHETNEFLSEALGVEVDEIIQVSTQTFNETQQELKEKDKLLVMTNRRIYFASFQQGHWIKSVENLKDISTIGLKHTFNLDGAIQMRISFIDNTSWYIDLDVTNKTTTTPLLFAKKFLETIDNHLLGRLPEKKSRRRRVTTNTEGQPSAQPTVSQSIIKGISEAEQVSGRKLDL